MKNTTQDCVELAENHLFEIAGGVSKAYFCDEPERLGPHKEPVYITMAIGEDGGKLPDILS